MKKKKQNHEEPWTHAGGKLVELGADKLSDAELLSILIGTGTKGKSAEQLAGEIVRRFGKFNEMAAQPLNRYLEFKGMGDVKIIRIAAVFEIARRILNQALEYMTPDKKVVPYNGNEDVIAWKNKLYRAITSCLMLPEQMDDWLLKHGDKIHKISADEKQVFGFQQKDDYIYCNGRLYRALNDEIKSFDEITEWSFSPKGRKFLTKVEKLFKTKKNDEKKNNK